MSENSSNTMFWLKLLQYRNSAQTP